MAALNANLAPTRLGVLRKVGKKRSPESNKFVHTLKEAFEKLSEATSRDED